MDGCRLSLLENAPKQIFSRKEPFIEGRAFTGNWGWPQSSPPHNRKNIFTYSNDYKAEKYTHLDFICQRRAGLHHTYLIAFSFCGAEL